MSEPGVIDPGALERLLAEVGGERDFVTELIDIYLEDAPAQLQAMQRALLASDGPALRQAAHSLKANSTSFGAAHLAALCQHLETMARDGSLEEAARSLPPAREEYERVAQALRSLRESART